MLYAAYVYLYKWLLQNLGLALEFIVPLHMYNHIHIGCAFMLFDISDLYEASHMLELFLPSRLIVAQRLEILIERIVQNVSFNPFLPSPSLFTYIGEVNVCFILGASI